MFNEAFFPTPKPVIDQMLAPLIRDIDGRYYLGVNRILEPSAGKGDIVNHLIDRYNIRASQVSCIEVEPELQMILNGKGYKVIDTDFLNFFDHYSFDLIVMNPPFDQGAAHLLKAWEVMQNGDIACLLNAETILNPYTKERQLLAHIIEQHGSYKVIGQVFQDAERRTGVNCVIVWLHKETKSKSTVGFDDANMEKDWSVGINDPEFTANPLAHANIIQSLVDQYNKAAELLVQLSDLKKQYRYYTYGIGVSENNKENTGIPTEKIDKAVTSNLHDEIDALKEQFWKHVFQKTSLGKVATSNFRKKFEKFAEETERLAFSEANIMSILEIFFLNRDTIILECIAEVFDKATAYHEDNKVHDEGWKTNKSWRIAPKIILPRSITYEAKWYWSPWSSNSYHSDFFQDLDKALCFLTNKKLDEIYTVHQAIEERIKELNKNGANHQTLFESTFFTIRVFKKGTVHLVFKDKDLLARFNYAAAKNKNWVGNGS